MAMWQWGLLALGVLWALQSLGVWYQMRHYGDVMKGITSKYNVQAMCADVSAKASSLSWW